MAEVLIVDGYNIIGSWPNLKSLSGEGMEAARYELLSLLADYGAYTGIKVIVVFDAHRVSGIRKKTQEFQIEICYTKENETADEYIEKLVSELKGNYDRIYVATSDQTEQKIVFGQGALRLSARELLLEIENIQNEISDRVKSAKHRNPKKKIELNDEIAKIFEKWRRE